MTLSGTIVYAFVSNCVNNMYIYRYSYVVAAALSDTKGNRPLDDSVTRRSSQSCTDTVTELRAT